jgi:hypothetical protein
LVIIITVIALTGKHQTKNLSQGSNLKYLFFIAALKASVAETEEFTRQSHSLLI